MHTAWQAEQHGMEIGYKLAKSNILEKRFCNDDLSYNPIGKNLFSELYTSIIKILQKKEFSDMNMCDAFFILSQASHEVVKNIKLDRQTR